MKPAPSKFIERYLADLSAGSRVLDLACGSGRHTKLALDMGLSVTAIDIDVSRLEDLRDHRDLTVLEADLESGPWPLRDNGFDAVIVANYLWRPLFPKIADTVSTGGLLLYETFMAGNERFGKPSNPDFTCRRMSWLKSLARRSTFWSSGRERKPILLPYDKGLRDGSNDEWLWLRTMNGVRRHFPPPQGGLSIHALQLPSVIVMERHPTKKGR